VAAVVVAAVGIAASLISSRPLWRGRGIERAEPGDVARLRPRTLLLDGEAVAFDPKQLVSSFQLLQNGSQPVVFAAFDCLYVDGKDLREQPPIARRAALNWAQSEPRHPTLLS
jgi:hypothetical protein